MDSQYSALFMDIQKSNYGYPKIDWISIILFLFTLFDLWMSTNRIMDIQKSIPAEFWISIILFLDIYYLIYGLKKMDIHNYFVISQYHKIYYWISKNELWISKNRIMDTQNSAGFLDIHHLMIVNP